MQKSIKAAELIYQPDVDVATDCGANTMSDEKTALLVWTISIQRIQNELVCLR